MVITNTSLSGDGTYSPLQRSVTRFKSLRPSLRNLVCAIAECHTLYTSKRNRDSISYSFLRIGGGYFFFFFLIISEPSAFLIFLRYTGEARMQWIRLWLKNPPGTGGGQDVEVPSPIHAYSTRCLYPIPENPPRKSQRKSHNKPKRSKKKKEKTRPTK